MLVKQMLGYSPSFILPALCTFGTVYFYTRLLTPEQYGHYTLAINSMMLLNAVCFNWLQTSLSRLFPAAQSPGDALKLRATCYAAFLACAGVLGVVAAMAMLLEWERAKTILITLTAALAILRALLNLAQAVHRSQLGYGRYNRIECGVALLGFALGLLLVAVLHLGVPGALTGLLLGLGVMVVYDRQEFAGLHYAHADAKQLRELTQLGLPLALVYGLAFITSTSDRFLLEFLRGPEAVGIYAAGYALMDRISTLLFLLIAIPALPLTVHRLEREGLEAARAQTLQTGSMLMMLALPACAGLMLASGPLAAVLIGESFRAGAIQVMPCIAVSGFCNGLATHYFEHAFFLGKKTRLLLVTQGSAALANIALNLLLIPRFGIMGAAYATVCSYGLLLVMDCVLGRRVFAIRFPVKTALQAFAATLIMAAALHALHFSNSLAGLVRMVTVSAGIYAVLVLAFNILQLRSQLVDIIRKQVRG